MTWGRIDVLARYNRWNDRLRRLLWILTAVGVLAAMPLMLNRLQMERSANTVEFVVDLGDLVTISEFKGDPDAYVREQLAAFKAAGVGAMAIYESTLEELERSDRIRLFNAFEAMLLTGSDEGLSGNRTYLFFTGEKEREVLEPIIRDGFGIFGIGVEEWSHDGKAGLAIDAGYREAVVIPLDPDPLLAELLSEFGFRIAVRLSDGRPYDQQRMDAMLSGLARLGADTLVFNGKQVTGFEDDDNAMALTGMAELVNKHGLRIAVIEQPMAKQQQGIGRLSALSGYKTVRLHSVLEEESFQDAEVLADRFVLAVKDRNIRMIYLNTAVRVDPELSKVEESAHNLLVSLKDPDFGAVARIQALGYELGAPQPFDIVNPGWEQFVKLLVILGAVALIARMIAFFLPWVALPVFAAGLAGTAGLYVLSPTIAMQALALLASVSAPTAGVISGIRLSRARLARRGQTGEGRGLLFAASLGMFVRTLLLSLVGAVYIVALLNHVSYLYVLNQFRGVSVLHVLPIFLVAVYVLFFNRAETFGQVLGNMRRFLLANIKVVWVMAGAVIGVVMLYYLSRTGNEGVVLPFDRQLRTMLEGTFGVRPRTKEMLTQPLMILAFYLFWRHRGQAWAWALAVAGTMGILSPVDTFAHLHTPLAISALRVLYGALISIGLALAYWAIWEFAARSWTRWRHKLPSLE